LNILWSLNICPLCRNLQPQCDVTMPRATKCNVTARGAAALGNWSSISFRGGGGANVHLIRAKIVARMGWRRGFLEGAWQRQAARTRHLALACHLPLSQFPASFLPSFTLWFSLIAYSGRIYLHMQW